MNIYISGLNFSTTDADLNDLFSEYGEVSSARIITDRETRRSRGFGFVEMPDDTAGQKAIDELNGAGILPQTNLGKRGTPAKKDLPMAAIATEEAVTTLEDINILNYWTNPQEVL